MSTVMSRLMLFWEQSLVCIISFTCDTWRLIPAPQMMGTCLIDFHIHLATVVKVPGLIAPPRVSVASHDQNWVRVKDGTEAVGQQHVCGLMAMGAAAPGGPYESGPSFAKSRYTRPAKPSPRANEVGITSQEAVEFAISYAKQQRQRQEAQQGSQQQHAGHEHQLAGPEGDKHYHACTKSQSGQLIRGAGRCILYVQLCASPAKPFWLCRQSVCRRRGCSR